MFLERFPKRIKKKKKKTTELEISKKIQKYIFTANYGP